MFVLLRISVMPSRVSTLYPSPHVLHRGVGHPHLVASSLLTRVEHTRSFSWARAFGRPVSSSLSIQPQISRDDAHTLTASCTKNGENLRYPKDKYIFFSRLTVGSNLSWTTVAGAVLLLPFLSSPEHNQVGEERAARKGRRRKG